MTAETSERDGLSSSAPLRAEHESHAQGSIGLYAAAAFENPANTHDHASPRSIDPVHSAGGVSDRRDRPGADPAPCNADAVSPETVDQAAFWQELRQLRAKPLAELTLPAELARRYAHFEGRYPGIDPSEKKSLADHNQMIRSRYPFRMNDEQRQSVAHAVGEARQLGRDLIVERAQASHIPISGQDPHGRGFHLRGFVDGQPQYAITSNASAAYASGSTWLRRSDSFDPPWSNAVDGSGLVVAVTDSGTIYEHPEFTDGDERSRIIFKDEGFSSRRDHMTHVAGTIAARGIDEDAMGMAPGVYVRAPVISEQVRSFSAAYPNAPWQSVMGSTSLGSSDPRGVYDWRSRNFDNDLLDYPYYLHFYAAGNSGGFNSLDPGRNIAKNVLTVGGIGSIDRNEDGSYQSGGSIASWSSRGPTQDGRIKPDLVAKGTGLRSPDSPSGYGSKSGTSMATPNASGGSVLVMDYFRQRFHGQMMRAATVRALLINTAIDLGNPGPDYTYGWGAIDVLAAAQLIRSYADDAQTRLLREELLQQDQGHQFTYYSDGAPIRVTLVWHEQGGPNSSSGPVLVNNLHLRIQGPGGAHYPFVMPYVTGTDDTDPFDPDLYSAHAVTGENHTDNVVQVAIADPSPGTYTIEVYHQGELAHEQDYSLAIQGLAGQDVSQPVITEVDYAPQTGINHQFTISGEDFMVGARVEFRRSGQTTQQAHSAMVHPHHIAVRMDNRAMTSGVWQLVVVNPDGAEASADYEIPARHVLHASDFANDDHAWTLEGSWAVHVPESDPRDAAVGERILSSHPNTNVTTDTQIDYAYSPVWSMQGRSNAVLSMRRWLEIYGAANHLPRWNSRLEYAINGGSWSLLWEDGNNVIRDHGWQYIDLPLPSVVDNADSLQLRFSIAFYEASDPIYGIADSNFHTGWNLDDVSLIAHGEIESSSRSIRIRRLGDLLWLISPDDGIDADDGEGDEAEFAPLDTQQQHTLTPVGGSG
ncbi:MAG: hypothetical protein EA401_07590 [Planctomycetota bacterium]|nr:MAG: hypothetical protein EA401_07590 [Planctomycetota bacterium]